MISFHSFGEFPDKFFDKKLLKNWLQKCAQYFHKPIIRLSYQFCDENTMLAYNRKYLNHDDYTDILTFPEDYQTNDICGDVLINIDRLKDNARRYEQTEKNELLRLLAHGFLHLLGMDDKTPELRAKMTELENKCMTLFEALD